MNYGVCDWFSLDGRRGVSIYIRRYAGAARLPTFPRHCHNRSSTPLVTRSKIGELLAKRRNAKSTGLSNESGWSKGNHRKVRRKVRRRRAGSNASAELSPPPPSPGVGRRRRRQGRRRNVEALQRAAAIATTVVGRQCYREARIGHVARFVTPWDRVSQSAHPCHFFILYTPSPSTLLLHPKPSTYLSV